MYFNRKNAEQKNWRMIKKGKQFLFGCSLVFAIGAALVAPSVKADTVEANPEAGSTTEGIKPVVAEEDVTYAAPAVEVAPSTLVAPDTVVTEEKAEKPVATTENSKEEAVATTTVSVDKSQLEAVLAQAKAKSLEGQEASVKAEVAAAIAEAEALVANGSASQEKVNQSVERLTQALASVKEVTEVVAEKRSEATTESSETPKIRNKRAVEGSLRSVDESNLQRAVVTKENFESFFQEGGTASYDKSTGTIKLTDDVSGQVGSAYLRFKIDSGQPFTFTGKVDIGDKYEGHTVGGRPGGDGVGFVFHTGNVDTIGQDGASIGMGTIKNAFGFKLDSWHNTSNPNANQNASADPRYGGNAWRSNAFGSFYSSNNAGRVTTSSSAAKALNPAPSGQWVDFKIEYDSQKNFTVTYGSQTWTTNLKNASTSIMTTDAKNAFKNNPTFALSFLGSTGSGSNLQRVQIERFEFTAPQIVHMKFVDTKGNEIEASSAIPGDRDQVINLSTQDSKIAAVEAKGYKLKRIDHSKARSYNEANNTVTLKEGGQLLTYIFEEKEKDAASIQAPTNKVPVKNTTALTEDEKSSVEAAVKAVNPKATKVEVATDGAATVTFEDGTTATLTGDKTVKEADSKGVKAPTTKTPVQNTSALTQPEKDAVKKAVEDANQTATKVEVGNDGSATVTFPDGTTATLPGAKTVKEADSKGVQEPAAKTPVQNTSALTQPEKDAVKKAVADANQTATKVEVGNDGSATVTFPDGTTATLPGAKTVKEADSKGVQEPAAKTPVQNTSALTQPEKDAVKKAVEDANQTATKVEVGNDGSATVTFPDGTTATLPGAKTVKEADSKGVQEPAAKTPVQNTSALTQPEKDAVKKAVEDANQTATKVEVGNDGSATVTFPDGTTATLPGAKTVKEADSKGVQEPAAKTPVQNTSALTQPEKDAVKKAVEAANPGSVAEVGQDGTTKVTFPDKSEGTLTGDQTVKAADANGAKAPEAKTPVKDTANLTDAEKAEVKKAVEAANPGSVAEVGQDGTTKVTFPDKSEGTLTPAQTVVKAEEKAKDADGLKAPETKTPVKDTANLTDAEKAEVKKAVEAANPGSVAEVGQDGTTKVTFPDKSEGTLTPAQTVVKAEEKAKDADGLKAPETKTPVKDTANLTDAEKAEVKKAVEAANPGSVAEVGQDGTTKVTFPDKSEGTLTPAQTVVKAEEKAKDADGLKAPETKTPVKDTANLTDAEKAEVKKAVEAANPGSVAEVGQDGTTKVTFPDKSEGTLTPAQTVVKAEEKAKDADGLKAPETKTPVKDTANLTDAEKAEVKKAVEAANPGSVAEVGQDGTTKVTFPDKSEGTLTPAQTVVKAEEKAKDADGLKAPETKTPVKDTANLTDAEKAEVKKAVEAANPGSVAEVGQDGTTTVTFPDKSEGTLTGDQTVKAADANGAKAPEAKTPVKDTANLTEEEKTQVAEEILKANPTLADVDVANDGTATLTFPDGSKATLTPAQTVVKAEEKAKDADGLKAPETKTPVKDTANLTDAEKAEVKKAVEAANPGSVAEVGQDGTTKVTFPDKSEGTLTPAQTVVKAEEKAKDADGLKAPETKTPVKDTANLTDAEKAEVKKAVEAANPGSVAEVGQDGITKVTFPDGSTATLTGDKTVKEADSKGVQEPAAKTPVQNTSALTQPEKDAVKKAVADANPTATKVEVGNDGSATVTFPDGSTATLTPAQTVVKAEDKEAPTAPVVNPVKAGDTAITGKAEAGSTVEVTLPNGTKATATAGEDGTFSVPVSGLNEGDKVSVTATDAAGNKSGATEATVAKADDKTAPDAPKVNEVKAGDTAVTGTAEAGSTVEVTLPNGTKATATAGEDGTFSVPVSGLNEGDKVSVTATDAAGNKSGATEATVAKADDKEAPAAPVVNDVKEGDKAVTGTAEVGSIIEITLPNSETVTVRADEAGHFSLPVVGLKAGDKVTAVAKDASGNTSTPTEKTVGKRDVKDADGIQAPSTKTPVKDTANLTDAEKAKVKEAVEAANPGSKAEVGQDGTTTVTFPDGSTATLTGDQTVKTADSNGVQAPTTKTPVKDTANLTDAEKAKVKEAVEAANPGSKAEVGQDGTTTVTFPDGSTATLTGDQTVKSADANGVKAPSAKTPVKDTANLTDAEKAKVKEAVEAANPGSKAEVGQDGTTTVTFPDGSTATLTGDQTVKTADANGVQAPSTKTPVKDTANLTDAEKAKVKEAVEAANPGSKAEVGQDGTTTVTFPDGSTATLTGDQTVKTADANGVKVPTTKTPVKDTANLTDAEKAKVKEAVEAANPGSKAEVGQDGTTKVTFPDGSTATLTGDQTVKTADANGVKVPTTKTPVKDTANLTDAEKAKVKEAVEAANPGSKAEVGQDGTTTVTFPDGSTATLTGDQTVKTADANGVKAPSTKTPVKDTANLTDAEKAKVKEAVEAANPGSKAEVGQDGTTTVTFPDGSTATLTGDQTVKTSDANGVKAPSTKTPVKDTANLTDAEKAKVKEAVEAANPGSKAEVGQDGTTTVTFPDGSTATLTGDKTVTQADITAPTAPVVNPVKAGDTAVTGTAEAGSTVEVTLPDGTKVSAKADKDGKFSIPVNGLNAGDTVSVTATDESGNTSATTTVTVSNVNVGGKEADNAKVPALTPVVDPNNLTDAEKAKVAEEVKKANPTATDVKVNNDGSVVVTFADGSVATIAANKVVKEATKESPAQAPAKKAGAKELPNTGTKQSNASLGLALLAAVTGGLLISKKRKEEE